MTSREIGANVGSGNRGESQKVDPTEPVYRARTPHRPTLLTSDVERMFLNCLKAGNYRTVCSRLIGLSPSTVERWIARGRGTDVRPSTPQYIRFARLVEEAEATVEVIVVGNIVKRSAEDHNAGFQWLRAHPERRVRWPAHYDDDGPPAPPPPQLPAGPTTNNVDARQVNVVVLSQDQVPEVVHDLLAQQRQARIEAQAARPAITEAEPEHGRRVARLNDLRVEADGTEPADDESDF